MNAKRWIAGVAAVALAGSASVFLASPAQSDGGKGHEEGSGHGDIDLGDWGHGDWGRGDKDGGDKGHGDWGHGDKDRGDKGHGDWDWGRHDKGHDDKGPEDDGDHGGEAGGAPPVTEEPGFTG